MKIVKLVFLLIFLGLIPLLSFAQNEIGRERISLQGLQEFGFTANIEGSREVADHESLTPSIIRDQAVEQLVQNDLRYVSDEEVESSAREAYPEPRSADIRQHLGDRHGWHRVS